MTRSVRTSLEGNGPTRWLFTWVGQTDLDAARTRYTEDVGPLAQALTSGQRFDRVVLLCNYPASMLRGFVQALAKRTGLAPASMRLHQRNLPSPIDYGAIYNAACEVLATEGVPRDDTELTFHLSPGTPAMAAIWLILARTRFPARLIQASRQLGIEEVTFTFDLATDFLPEYLLRTERHATHLLTSDHISAPHFSKIVRRCSAMDQAVDTAQRFAMHDVPVLILGETGTGKELFAEAMAASSRRAERPFVAVNCGTLTPEMANAELFGHKKGAFTGATADRRGYMTEADGGTLFLDEVGELPHDSQVRLLRTLQSGEVTPVGASRPIKVDVRVIAATHRDLQADVAAGRFREDLFHRLAVGIVHLPPLRERGEDLDALLDHFIGAINHDSTHLPEWRPKTLTGRARRLLRQQAWPGNIRELYNTLVRSCVWSRTEFVDADDIERSLLGSRPKQLLQPGSNLHDATRFSSSTAHICSSHLALRQELDGVARQRIQAALEFADGHKGHAAALLGLGSHQTLANWIRRLGMQGHVGTDIA